MSQAPEKNMRRLKRVQTETGLSYTLETESERTKDNLLCNYCAWKVQTKDYPMCKTYSDMLDMQKDAKISVMVRTCATYQPIIAFRPKLMGFDGTFNTFRMGTAWFGRLMPGVIIGLMNAENDEIFAKAEVIKVVQGKFPDMCDQHAYMNHMLLGMEPEDASEKMRGIIRQAYGKFVHGNMDSSMATVIYLKNLQAKE